MAEHEPNMVPTLAQHPRKHWQKWGRRSQNCTLLFCKSKIGFAHPPCPPLTPPPRAKLHQLLALFQRFLWQYGRTIVENRICTRATKGKATSTPCAVPALSVIKERNKNEQPKDQNTVQNCVCSWYLCFFLQTPCIDEISTTLECPNPRQRPTQIPK